MNIEQLTYIVEVSRSKSLASAAKTLYITPAALSQAITKLESELNLQIFKRTSTGVFTTKGGEKIINKAQNALNAIEQIKEEAQNKTTHSSDIIRISNIVELTNPINNVYHDFSKNSSLNITVN